MLVMAWALFGALIGVAAAQKRGFSIAGGVLGGLLLGPLAVLMFLVSGVSRSDQRRKCPFCAEFVKAEATICKHCRKTLTSLPAAVGTLPMAVGSRTATRSALGRVAVVVVGLECAALAVAGYNSDLVLSALGVVGGILAFAFAW